MNNVLGTEDLWVWAFVITAIPAMLQIISLAICPESPKYLLMNKDDMKRAKTSLLWLRNYQDVTVELDQMLEEKRTNMMSTPTASWKKMFTTKPLQTPLLIACIIMISQRFTGVTAILFYSTAILRSAGLGEDIGQIVSVMMEVTSLVMTFVSLFQVEKCGRKSLLLTGLFGMLFSTTLLFSSLIFEMPYVSITSMVLFMACYGTGLGPIAYFLVGELFDQSYRPMATSFAGVLNWGAGFSMTLLFPMVE